MCVGGGDHDRPFYVSMAVGDRGGGGLALHHINRPDPFPRPETGSALKSSDSLLLLLFYYVCSILFQKSMSDAY